MGSCFLAVAMLGVGAATAAAATDAMPNRDALQGTSVVVWGNTTQANGIGYTIDFGDGSPNEVGVVADRSYIATNHTYASAGVKTVTLTVGLEVATTQVNVIDPATLTADQLRGIKINLAIQDGLRWLYVNQDNRAADFDLSTTSWSEASGAQSHSTSYTSLTVLAFENHGYQVSNDDAAPVGLYQKYVVQRGLNYLFDTLNKVTLQCGGAAEPAGDPCVGVPADADVNQGLGQTFDGPTGYSTSVAALAVAGSGAMNRHVAAGLGMGASGICGFFGCNTGNGGFVAGKTYKEVLQRQTNTIVWAQADDSTVCGSDFNRGGWRYGLDDCQSDGSAIGWALLALLDAGAAGATVPAHVATELPSVIANTSCDDGGGPLSDGLGYDSCFPWSGGAVGAGNVLRTGIALQAHFYMSTPIADPRVVNARDYINDAWNAVHPNSESASCGSPVPVGPTSGSQNNKGCAYAMFQVFKGLKLLGITTLSNSTRADKDWHKEYQDYALENQHSPTSTSGGEWGNPQMLWSCCDNDTVGMTALIELMLSPVALVLPANITLAPPTATNPVGTMHTVTATVTSASGGPVPGATVTFTVTSGPNMGVTGTAVTDSEGLASFTYTSNGLPGTDTIEASVGNVTSNEVTKTWVTETPSTGRMTGGGSVFTASGDRVTHGFELHCSVSTLPNRLEVNWGKGDKFHMEVLTSATCTDDPAIAPNPPSAGFDTFTGTGTGRYNGVAGATIEFTFTDAGEPGKNDTATIVIKDAANVVVQTVSGTLTNGNHQAHKD